MAAVDIARGSAEEAPGAFWRDRGAALAGAALVAVAAVAWIAVLRQAAGGDMPMAGPTPSLGEAALFIVSWGVMMAAMMLPSALPMIALYATVSRRMSQRGQQAVPTALFTATYLVSWLAFGVPVYLASVAVAALAGGDGMGAAWLPYALAAVLIAAGAYQFTAVKRVCLHNCRTPLSFLMTRWRTGYAATLRLGISHATYCVGCCWGLMVVLVAAGAMSLPWVLGIAALVFVEKLLPRGAATSAAIGGALILLGLAVAVRPDLAVALRSGPTPGMSMSGMAGM